MATDVLPTDMIRVDGDKKDRHGKWRSYSNALTTSTEKNTSLGCSFVQFAGSALE